MLESTRRAVLFAVSTAVILACGSGNTSNPGGGNPGGDVGSSGGAGNTSGSSSGNNGAGSTGSSSGGGFVGSDDAGLPGSDDASQPGVTSDDATVDGDAGLDSDGSGTVDSGVADATTTPVEAGADAASTDDAGHDAGTTADAGHDAGATADAGHDGGSPADAGHSSGDGGSSGSTPTMIPTPTGTCPTIANTGTGSSVLTYAGHSITVWAGATPTTPGPLVIYWYATGGSPAQAVQALGGQAGISKITSLGGIVVAPNTSTQTGSNTGDLVWYTGDVAQVDEVVACAVQQKRVDPRHIHVLGYSAGALQTVYMWFARSGYVASELSYSGGDDTIDKTSLQDPSNVPPAVVAHGAMGMDTFGTGALSIDFYTASHTWESDIQKVNGFDIDCNDGSTHVDETTRFKIAPEGIQFFLDHPFKGNPDAYAGGLPAAWPSYCTIAND